MNILQDQHGRKIRKLRLSLTDKCNLRCHYCMPLDAMFMDERRYLSPSEYGDIIKELCALGLEEVRLTGGEPLLRKSFREIAEKLSTLPLKKLGLTTNGIFLDQYLDVLRDHRIHHLNVSLDSLDPENFRKITAGNFLPRILRNIEEARRRNFLVKINVVAMRGVNDHELPDFVRFSAQTGLEVRFLEFMRIGHACESQKDQFIAAAELVERLRQISPLKPVVREADSTSFNFLLGNNAQIGFIASESQPFCGHCSRWRLSADGVLRACLLKSEGLSIKHKTPDEREEIYQSLLGMKPLRRPEEVHHKMNEIGG